MTDGGARHDLHCLVEIPKGSRNRYRYDDELGAIALDRFLFSSVVHPADCGFITEALDPEGRRLAAVVCVSAPTFPGCVIPVRAVGLLRMRAEGEADVRVVCVPLDDPAWREVRDVDDLPDGLREEIAHFFAVHRGLDGEEVGLEGWDGREAATEAIDEGRARYREATA